MMTKRGNHPLRCHRRCRDKRFLYPPTSTKSSPRLKGKATIFPAPQNEILTDDHVYDKYVKKNPMYANYLLTEWGFETHNEHELFEHLSLSGAQSGISWWTVLSKREAYRQAFHYFNINKVASMTMMDVDKLMSQESENKTQLVVKNKKKIMSVIHNAQIIQKLKANGTITSLSDYLWSFVDNKPILNQLQNKDDMPTQTKVSERMNEEMKKLGFQYVGPKVMYAMMQSCGLVMDYLIGSKHLANAEERLKNRVGGYQIS